MNTGPATTANAAPVEEGHGEDEQAPPDEHLAEVVGVAGVPPEAARDEAPAVLVPRLEARLLRVGHGLDQEAGRPERHAGDRPRPGFGRVVTAEKVGDRQHPTATVIACKSQKRAKRSGLSLISSKRWSTLVRRMRRNR